VRVAMPAPGFLRSGRRGARRWGRAPRPGSRSSRRG
jgi:hypothetical protein